jgi:hypothetical protein
MRISSDEPEEVADMSLAPLNKLGHMSLTSYVPTGTTNAATYMHNFDASEEGPRMLALRHLEQERQKIRETEAEQDKLQREEQEKTSMLKELELERQRKLNKRGFLDGRTVPRSFSFETTTTARSSIKSPTSASQLLPCVICKSAERTHVATPCMHLSYCTDCAHEMKKSAKTVCLVCQKDNISFARVYM